MTFALGSAFLSSIFGITAFGIGLWFPTKTALGTAGVGFLLVCVGAWLTFVTVVINLIVLYVQRAGGFVRPSWLTSGSGSQHHTGSQYGAQHNTGAQGNVYGSSYSAQISGPPPQSLQYGMSTTGSMQPQMTGSMMPQSMAGSMQTQPYPAPWSTTGSMQPQMTGSMMPQSMTGSMQPQMTGSMAPGSMMPQSMSMQTHPAPVQYGMNDQNCDFGIAPPSQRVIARE